jgi:dihydrofolate synthase/folylpolyglutamate synthase
MVYWVSIQLGSVDSLTVTEALNFIHSVSWRGSVPGLSRTRELLHRLGDPQERLRFVHIAGTNGKGSVAAMLSSVLTAAGLCAGLYTSPYIARFNERMQVCGVPIPDGELAEVTALVAPHARSMADPPTEFELVTAIALLWFARRGCEIVVLEVGLGGRLDSTNVIDTPDCAVIANIGLDHTQLLGRTTCEIAREKAGIIKPGGRVVLYEQDAAVMAVFAEVCRAQGAALTIADFSAIRPTSDSLDGQIFLYKDTGPWQLPLLGAHQLKNAAVALEAIRVLREQGFAIPAQAVRDGLAGTSWPARFEIVSRAPWFVVDGGHNPQCAETAAENLSRYFPGMRRALLIGTLQDKDYAGLLDTLDPVADAYVAVTPDNPRALPAAELGAFLTRYDKPVTVCDTIARGVAAAKAAAGERGVACAVGSLYMAGAVRACFGLK